MKRKIPTEHAPKWMKKLDVQGQHLVTAHRWMKQFEANCADPQKREQFVRIVRSCFPGAVPKEEIDISPATVDSLKAVGLWPSLTPGKQMLSASKAQFISNVGNVKELMENPEFEKAFPVAGGFLLSVFENLYEQIAMQNFGTQKLNIEQAAWTVGSVLIAAGRLLKGEKNVELSKGRANAKHLEILKIVRTHQTKKIMPKELKQIFEYVGLYVPDAETIRIFEWRAKKKGQL